MIITGIKKAANISFVESVVITRQRIDNIVPRKKLPESPMKSLAGGKLKIIKPKQDPIRIVGIIKISNLPEKNRNKDIIIKAIEAIPEDNPSRLSLNLQH